MVLVMTRKVAQAAAISTPIYCGAEQLTFMTTGGANAPFEGRIKGLRLLGWAQVWILNQIKIVPFFRPLV